MSLQRVRHGFLFVRPRRVIEGADKNLFHGAIGLLLGAELDGVTFRLFQDQQGDLEQRIRAAGHFDLTREHFHTLFLGNERDIQHRQRSQHRRLTAFGFLTVTATAIITPAAATRTRTTTTSAATGTTGTRTTVAAAKATTTTTAGTIPAWATTATGSTRAARPIAATAFRPHTFLAGEFFITVGLGLPLRPSGLEQVFQVEV